MRQLATALAILARHVDRRTDETTEDDDVVAMEAAASELGDASPDERAALIAALEEMGWDELVEALELQ